MGKDLELEKIYFVSFCIEQYKTEKNIDGEEAFKTFEKYGVDKYLEDFYDVLHTQGHQWLMEEIDEYIKNKTV